jgi:hypothetical protein
VVIGRASGILAEAELRQASPDHMVARRRTRRALHSKAICVDFLAPRTSFDVLAPSSVFTYDGLSEHLWMPSINCEML